MQLIAGGGSRTIIANIRIMISSGMDKETAIQRAIAYAKKTRKRSTRRRGKDKKKRKRRSKRSMRPRRTGADYYRSLF